MSRFKLIAFISFLVLVITTAMTYRVRAQGILFSIDANHPTDVFLPNIASNINTWQMKDSFVNSTIEFSDFNEFRFVKWVQIMLCSGGSESRDLFKNPKDRSILNDYDFELLINNCEGILRLGAKPYLKLGAVPLKYTTDPHLNEYGFNMNPPDSYGDYYHYIKSLIAALVDIFGKDEVQSWRFGCLVEYENGYQFSAQNGNSNDSFIEYCKLYDYTVQALTDILGNRFCVGAHSMSVLDGLWDERDFIEHVANGRNFANGSIGTKIDFLSISFYDYSPGRLSSRSLAETIKPLQEKAKECGLNNLFYGVDEGRVLSGSKGTNSSSLNSRSSGFTWQASEDARLFSQALVLGMDYFSAWSYLTGGNMTGYPTVSYHIANNMAKFEGYRRLNVDYIVKKDNKHEIGCIAGIKKDTVRVMIYNFSTDVRANGSEDITLDFKLPYNSRKSKIVKWLVNDDCNFFDEWLEDRKKYHITNDSFFWSPDDGQIESSIVLSDTTARKLYYEHLRSKYILCSLLKPETSYVRVKKGNYSDNLKLASNNVLFIQITKR